MILRDEKDIASTIYGLPLANKHVAMLAGFDEDITAAIPHGAEVEVNPQIGVLTLMG